MIYPYSSDIYTICSSAKLLYHCLRPYIVEKQVGSILKLPSTLWRLYLVVYVIKLTLASNNLISSRYSNLPPDSIIVMIKN